MAEVLPFARRERPPARPPTDGDEGTHLAEVHLYERADGTVYFLSRGPYQDDAERGEVRLARAMLRAAGTQGFYVSGQRMTAGTSIDGHDDLCVLVAIYHSSATSCLLSDLLRGEGVLAWLRRRLADVDGSLEGMLAESSSAASREGEGAV